MQSTHETANELDRRLKNLAQQERELLHEVLQILREIDRKKTFLAWGYSNLFDYLVNGIGYSEGAAQRRIDAARLIKEVPNLADKIKSGEITLNQVSVVQKAIRQIQRADGPDGGKKVSIQEKRDLVEKVANKKHFETQGLVAEFFDLPVVTQEKQIPQADQSVRIEVTLTREQFEKLKKAQALLSHSIPTGDMALFLERVSDRVIAQKTSSAKKLPKSGESVNSVRIKKVMAQSMANPAVAALKSDRKVLESMEAAKSTATVAVKLKKDILRWQDCCQFIDPVTKRACRSKWMLQIDHIQPRWAGGSNDLRNLQVLCAAHNREKYRAQSGIRRK